MNRHKVKSKDWLNRTVKYCWLVYFVMFCLKHKPILMVARVRVN